MPSSPLPDCLNEDNELEAQPVEILDFRYLQLGELELLIKWHGLQNHENSWELYKNLIQVFPHLHLKDKVPLDERGNVRTRVYVKRKRRGRKATLKEQIRDLTEGIYDNNRKQNSGAEGSSPKAVDDNVGSNISKQPKGTPGGSIPVAERITDMQQKIRSMLKEMEVVNTRDAELAIEDWMGDSKESRNRVLREEAGHKEEKKEKE